MSGDWQTPQQFIAQKLSQAHELETLQQQAVEYRGSTMHPEVRTCLELQVKINRKMRFAQEKMLDEIKEIRELIFEGWK